MARPSDIRSPIVAGRFYPEDPAACRREAQDYLDAARKMSRQADKGWIGAIVPHAGWICSAAIAAEAIAALAAQGEADVVVLFGAVHTPIPTTRAALDPHARWSLPTGEATLAQDLRATLAQDAALFAVDGRFHQQEHSMEVEVPLVQLAWPGAKLLPIAVPPIPAAVEIGRETARVVRQSGQRAVYLASTDLTHYGPNYRFTPAGIGPAALEWAKDNDRRLLRLVTDMQPERIVPEVHGRLSACGGGAIAALLSACRERGATAATVLRHTNSYETLASVAPQTPDNAVGYAAVVIG